MCVGNELNRHTAHTPAMTVKGQKRVSRRSPRSMLHVRFLISTRKMEDNTSWSAHRSVDEVSAAAVV